MAGSDELVVGKFDPYSDELAITQDHSVIAHVYGSDAGTVKAMALDFVLGRERAQKAEAEKARLTALLAEREAEIARLKLTTRSDREYAEQKQRAEEAEGENARLREALEWYADERNYDGNGSPGRLAVTHPTCRCPHCVLGFEPDAGMRARSALAARGGEVQG